MHRRFALIAAFVVAAGAVLGGCGGGAAADPYQLLADVSKTAWDPIQVNIGVTVQDGTDTYTLGSGGIGFVSDEDAGTFGLHLAIPLDGLDIDLAELEALGLTGDSLDVDVVFADDQLFVRSPFLGGALELFLGAAGELPDGDMTGWLRLGTAEELEELAGALGGLGGVPMVTPPPMDDADDVKASLEDMGVTLTIAGVEQRDGREVTHLEATVDNEKLLASDAFGGVAQEQLQGMVDGLEQAEITADLWVETSSKRLVEVDVRLASTDSEDQWLDVAVVMSDPDGSIDVAAPSDYVEIPIESLVTNLMQFMGEGMFGG